MATPTVSTPKRLDTATQLTASYVTQYTVPASTTTKVTCMIVCSSTTTARTVTINLVASGGTADTTNVILNAAAVPIDGTPLILEFSGLYMNTGDFISAKASAAAEVDLHLSGLELA